MPVEWSGSGPDVLVSLDRDSGVPLRGQLEDQFRQAIRSGRLGHDERVPSSRALATALGVSRGLVQECYAQLQAEGYLVTRGGSATRVARPAAKAERPRERRAAPPARLVADFATGVPDLGSMPRADWAWAIREVCRSIPNAELGYGDARGHPRLREVLAGYLRRVRAADADAGQVLVCSGHQQGLALVLALLAGRGARRVAVEDPGSADTVVPAAARARLVSVPVPVDEHGVDVAALERSDVDAVVLTPAHQWPTGVVLAPERRLALVAWAGRRGAVVVEDDYDAEFRYDREPVGSLQGLAPDHVVTLGTVSKSLAPTLRLGWVVSPAAFAGELATAKLETDRGSPGIDQLGLALLLESGRYDRHLRRMRIEYAARRDVLVRALAEHAPAVRLTGLAAGFHAVAHLPAGVGEATVVQAARRRSVGLYGMSAYRSDGAMEPPQLVLGFGNTSRGAIGAGIAAVADLVAGS